MAKQYPNGDINFEGRDSPGVPEDDNNNLAWLFDPVFKTYCQSQSCDGCDNIQRRKCYKAWCANNKKSKL